MGAGLRGATGIGQRRFLSGQNEAGAAPEMGGGVRGNSRGSSGKGRRQCQRRGWPTSQAHFSAGARPSPPGGEKGGRADGCLTEARCLGGPECVGNAAQRRAPGGGGDSRSPPLARPSRLPRTDAPTLPCPLALPLPPPCPSSFPPFSLSSPFVRLGGRGASQGADRAPEQSRVPTCPFLA